MRNVRGLHRMYFVGGLGEQIFVYAVQLRQNKSIAIRKCTVKPV